jgi:hypothetical protein
VWRFANAYLLSEGKEQKDIWSR